MKSPAEKLELLQHIYDNNMVSKDQMERLLNDLIFNSPFTNKELRKIKRTHLYKLIEDKNENL